MFPQVRLLVKFGASLSTCDSEGNTPLHLAVLQSNTTVSNTLLENGACMHTFNNAGDTPLQLSGEYTTNQNS